jgi:hypothetical protein
MFIYFLLLCIAIDFSAQNLRNPNILIRIYLKSIMSQRFETSEEFKRDAPVLVIGSSAFRICQRKESAAWFCS